jgi:hypothetical protein
MRITQADFPSRKRFSITKIGQFLVLASIVALAFVSIGIREASAGTPKPKYEIAVTQPAAGGKISPKAKLVKEGKDAKFTIKPIKGYHLLGVTIDGQPVFNGTTIADANLTRVGRSNKYKYVFKAVTQAHDIAAIFTGDNLTLRGSLGSGYTTQTSATTRSVGAAGVQALDKKVDKVIAIQSDRGYLGASSMQNSRSAIIGDDGTFSISLDTTKDWLLVLIDSTAVSRTDQFVGYIALNAGSSEPLLQVPSTTSTISFFDLGAINALGDVGQSENPVNPTDFSLNSSQLLALAKNDDAFKSVKNFIINYDTVMNVYYTLRPDFGWRGNYVSIDGVFQDPASYVYRHYTSQLDSNTTSINMDKICGFNNQARVTVELAPPSDVTTTSEQTPIATYNPDNPISSNNITCSIATDGYIEAADIDFGATNRYGAVSQSYFAPLSGDIPPGYWQYFEAAQLKGQFDLAVASPFGPEGEIKGFVPSIRINKDGTGAITSVDIKWYTWDSSASQYVEITDITVLRYLIGNGDVYFENTTGGTRTYESVGFDPALQTSITPSMYAWYYGTDGPPDRQVQGLGIFYSSGGIGYKFQFFR